MASVVSGQTVVHSESTNPSSTALPRNWLSDMGWPNWLVSLTLGAALVPSDVPRSRLGLDAAPGAPPPPRLEQPARASAATTTAPAAAVSARSRVRDRERRPGGAESGEVNLATMLPRLLRGVVASGADGSLVQDEGGRTGAGSGAAGFAAASPAAGWPAASPAAGWA